MESNDNQNNAFGDKFPSQHEPATQHGEDVTTDVTGEVSPSGQHTGGHKPSYNVETYTPSNLTIQPGNPYHRGYDQGMLPEILLNDPPFSSWNVQRTDTSQEKVSDLRLFACISILFNLAFGGAALIQAVRAREEYDKGNTARAKELNSIALGLGIAGIAISFFVGVIVVLQYLFF